MTLLAESDTQSELGIGFNEIWKGYISIDFLFMLVSNTGIGGYKF